MTLAETFMSYWIKLTWNKHKKYMKEYSLCHDITYNMIEFLKKYKYDVEIYKTALIETIRLFNRTTDRMLIEFINNADPTDRLDDDRTYVILEDGAVVGYDSETDTDFVEWQVLLDLLENM